MLDGLSTTAFANVVAVTVVIDKGLDSEETHTVNAHAPQPIYFGLLENGEAHTVDVTVALPIESTVNIQRTSFNIRMDCFLDQNPTIE